MFAYTHTHTHNLYNSKKLKQYINIEDSGNSAREPSFVYTNIIRGYAMDQMADRRRRRTQKGCILLGEQIWATRAAHPLKNLCDENIGNPLSAARRRHGPKSTSTSSSDNEIVIKN